ncbi:MAG: ABC transporter substrate-binding protein, partial [Hyphomicrobiaceae bacterium]
LLPELSIVNAELLKANEVNNDWGRAWLQSNDAGSGVLALKSETPTGTLVLERFAGHWTGEAGSASNSAPSEIELRPSIDPELRVDGLVKGEIHIAQGTLLPHQLKRLRETKDVALLESDSPRAFMGLLHAGREPMKSLAFRRALAQAFDADRFTATTLVGATPLPVPLPPSLGTLPAGLAKPAYDLGAAAAAIAKIKPVPKELVIGAIAGEPHSERAALVMLDGLVKIGLSARIVTEPWPAVANRMRDEKQMYDILFLWRGTRYLDANNWLGELYDCDLFGQGNASWYCNRDIDRLVKEARFALDPKLRRQGYEKAAALLAEDQAGLFIASGRRPTAYAKRVKGLRASPVGEALELRGVTLD